VLICVVVEICVDWAAGYFDPNRHETRISLVGWHLRTVDRTSPPHVRVLQICTLLQLTYVYYRFVHFSPCTYAAEFVGFSTFCASTSGFVPSTCCKNCKSCTRTGGVTFRFRKCPGCLGGICVLPLEGILCDIVCA